MNAAQLRSGRVTRKRQQGFTIVELMIATTVLSVILLMVSIMMISIGRLYFKGINQSRVQNNVRSIADELAQRLQFNAQDPLEGSPSFKIYGTSPPIYAYCIGNVRYTFVKDTQLTVAIAHVLWRDTLRSPGCPNDANLTLGDPSSVSTDSKGDGTELIAPRSRLVQFSLSPTSPYEVAVIEIYGDTDLLVNNPGPASACGGDIGDQFCARAGLKTTVGKRLSP